MNQYFDFNSQQLESPLVDPEAYFTQETQTDFTNEVQAEAANILHELVFEEEHPIDLAKAVRLNNYYQKVAGWGPYVYEIMEYLQKATGAVNKIQGPEQFASAVAAWQKKQGFTGNNVDGILGKTSWKAMAHKLGIDTPVSPDREFQDEHYESFEEINEEAFSENQVFESSDAVHTHETLSDEHFDTGETNLNPSASYPREFINSEMFHLDEVIHESLLLNETPQVVKPATEGHVAWAKFVVGKLLSVQLNDDNQLDSKAVEALKTFQKLKGIPETGKPDFKTERALLEAETYLKYSGTSWKNLVEKYLQIASTKIEDFTAKAVIEKSEITGSFRDPRKLWSFVLHQMAMKRRSRTTGQFSDPNSYLKTGAHFCILFDGRIIQLHPLSRLIYHGQCLSFRSVAVEFEGNFPSIKGRWWSGDGSTGNDNPTPLQFAAGKYLAGYLKLVLGITHIQAHRQSSENRENDPGPDVWYHVGQWAINNIGLTDGGSDFKCGSGNPILPEWRTWGERAIAPSNEASPDSIAEAMTGTDFSNAVAANRKYSKTLGWDQFYDQINEIVLPYSGFSNVSLGETEFAKALAGWQRAQGFAEKDCDGILGPVSWRILSTKLHAGSPAVISVPSQASFPDVTNIAGFNQWYATRILERMNQGFLGTRFNSKSQLEEIAALKQVLRINPVNQIIQILPVIYHIGEIAAANNYREIVIGSFIRSAAADGSCTGHCAGRCIDINHSNRDFSDPAATQMVIQILNGLNSLPTRFKKSIGFGLPFQGAFFSNHSLPKFKSASPSELRDANLAGLVRQLGIVFPDNDNHLHIQVKWM
jgi:hypothetical protein